jgi:hypothetical protein
VLENLSSEILNSVKLTTSWTKYVLSATIPPKTEPVNLIAALRFSQLVLPLSLIKLDQTVVSTAVPLNVAAM